MLHVCCVRVSTCVYTYVHAHLDLDEWECWTPLKKFFAAIQLYIGKILVTPPPIKILSPMEQDLPLE